MKSKTKILLSLLLASNMIVSCHNATPSESTSDKESPLSSTPSEQESPSIEKNLIPLASVASSGELKVYPPACP